MTVNSALLLLIQLRSHADTREENGYMQVQINGEWQWLHRVIAKEKMGAGILEGYEVHHIDGDKKNNQIVK